MPEKIVVEFIDSGSQYSTGVGLIYIFNLIVGTGALTMPGAFQSAGWLISLVTIVVLAFFSFITVTFMTESMAIANAVLRAEQQDKQKEDAAMVIPGSVSETSPLLQDEEHENCFEIKHRVEMGKMARLFFNKAGLILFNLCIIIYLYGDLSIYAVAVPKSIRDVACTFSGVNNSGNHTVGDDDRCWESVDLTRENAYRIFVAVFFFLLGPFVLFNVQKTKYLQIFTSLARWLAFGLMIILAVIQLAEGKGEGKPPVGDISGIPNLFGVCVYSFMCHHSLPSLITPIRNKSRLTAVLAGDYTLILVFYAVLSFTGIFTFRDVNDLYTLNFQPNESGRQTITHVKFFEYFLALFPVFTLSTNFPIIAITLRSNLQALLARPHFSELVNRYLIAVLAIVPPTIVAVITNEVGVLVGFTGSYAGTGIQYAIPSLLVLLARRQVSQLEAKLGAEQLHRSPFRHNLWVYLVLAWAALCVIFVTANHIITKS